MANDSHHLSRPLGSVETDAMSLQKEMLCEIARVINEHGPYRIDEWFTEDFKLVEPTKPDWPRGHRGAIKLLELFRTLSPPVQFIALDMVEEADRVAVRWQLHANRQGERIHLASIAIYRFEEGRIAEDWGIPIRGEWVD
jgi:predicted SnoaL-like aldol condensation-catalyzing enzyme